MDKVIVKEMIDEEEYMEIQESTDGSKLLYINQGFYASCLFKKEEALKIRDFINKHLV